MSTVHLEAETRDVQGKGASRRLRRDNKVPGVIYGGDKKAQSINLSANKVTKALETEAIYTGIFHLLLDGKEEQVILKDIQRHPYKPVVLHMDFQRVSDKDVLVRMIPLHFINGEDSPGHLAGGVVNHTLTQVEVRCQARYLPEFIEIDLINMQLDDVLHLSHIKLPKNVEFAIDPSDHEHDLPVVGIHISKAALSEEALEAAEAEAAAAAEASEGAEEGHAKADAGSDTDADSEADKAE